jgi:hypothetical protein
MKTKPKKWEKSIRQSLLDLQATNSEKKRPSFGFAIIILYLCIVADD